MVVVGGEEGDVAVADHVCCAHVHTYHVDKVERVTRGARLLIYFLCFAFATGTSYVPGVQCHNMRT